jgi:hypothetical protein
MQQQQQQDRNREHPPPPLQQQQVTVSAAAPSSAAAVLAHSTPAIAKQKQLHLPPKSKHTASAGTFASAKHCKACNRNLGVGQCPNCVEFAEHPPALNHKRARIQKKNGQDEVNA